MQELSLLIKSFDNLQESNVTISAEGYALWISWIDELSPHVTQAFQDYGGVLVKRESGQSIWYFFSTEILLALSKLSIWANYNPVSLSALAFPASLQVDAKKSLSLSIDKELQQQSISTLYNKLTILVHPKLQEQAAHIPGIEYNTKINLHDEFLFPANELAKISWATITVNPRMPYASSQGWYALVHPLGNQFDKKFQAGWRSMFYEIEEVLRRLNLKYSISENYLMFPIESLQVLREWTKSFTKIVFSMKDNDPEKYWPCVSVFVDKKGRNFNPELAHKIPIKWDTLSPNFPYINYRNAFLLGREFQIQDLHFATGKSSMDNWCTVIHADYSMAANKIAVLLPSKFTVGSDLPCFYCGIKTHDAASCPTRNLNDADKDFWQNFNDIDIDQINSAFLSIEVLLTKNGNSAYKDILKQEDAVSRVLMGSFNINNIMQLRSVSRIWLLNDKDINAEPEPNVYRENSPCWNYLEKLKNAKIDEVRNIENEVMHAISSSPRDWRLKSLLGFIYVERGDFSKALQIWKEAESQSSALVHQAWHYFLQARVHELLAKYEQALELYASVKKLLPTWNLPEYRRLVCNVKMGFAEQVQDQFIKMVIGEKEIFNRIILDPELERGHFPIMTALYPLWLNSLEQTAVEKAKLTDLLANVNLWFLPEHPIAAGIRLKIEELIHSLEVKNYIAIQNIIKVRPEIEENLNALKEKELKELKENYKNYLAQLEVIRDEASWFPFPTVLTEFNQNFNDCASILSWAFNSDFKNPEAFRQAQGYIEVLDESIEKLRGKLKFISTVRDATLFFLLLSKTFILIEIIGLILGFLAIPAILFYGNKIGLSWLQQLVANNYWELQRVLIAVISTFALGIAIMRSSLIFDKRREQMLENAKTQREQGQQQRLARIKREKAEENKAIQGEQSEEVDVSESK